MSGMSEKIIKFTLGLLDLAKELRNVSRVCQMKLEESSVF